MGWTSTHRPQGISNIDWFQNNYGPKHKILASSQVRGGPIYMAVQHLGDSMGGYVYGLVILTQWTRDDYNFSYKDIDESMGPNEDECPERILKLLSPIAPDDQSYARDWRERCWKNIERKKNRPKVRKGDVVKFAKPLKFTDGNEIDTFKFEKGNRFVYQDDFYVYPRWYKISKWRDREFEVLS